ncbi:hypothetical protein QYE76_060419 [Lolium multiflorum]|uniref:Reverse transcriptase domain-containing protein n=1 Tax=Lolium multiflorum TaxID=4521 RepID=A0AAD8RZ14_LOLMU|nr:hypothetical protein QYE76_060419 [Lolium multiflorum]
MSRVSLQDSINPKPQSEGIAEEYPRQLAPSVGNLSAPGKSSAVPVTSAAFLLESPTPADPRDPIRCGSFEFVPHPEAPHLIPAGSSGDMDATFGGVHFIIDSGGFLRLPRTSASGPKTSVGEVVTPMTTLKILSGNIQESNRGSFDVTAGRRKRRRDSHREEEERTAAHLRQDFQKIASKFGAKEELNAVDAVIDHTQPPADNRNVRSDEFDAAKEAKKLQIVDSTAGCDRLSFLDAYSGYNQIKLKKEDQELTAFITPHGVFCYNVMTFGLKNAGATYQRCMQACLGEQIGRNIEVYIDDIVVKTKHAATLIDDLRETFDTLDKYKIKLNPKKCFFGGPGGQVLGYFISARGIEANPLKIKAILDMEPPKNLHQVQQQLAGRLAALSRFIAKLGEKALPFYNLMRKSEKFEWTKEAQESFDNLKKILSTSPVLVTPREKETLLMYIAATAQVFSSVLVVEREEAGKVHGVQRPV